MALIVYGVVLVIAIGMRFGVATAENSFIITPFAWIMMAAATVNVGYDQMNLLPFMNAKPVTHWIGIGLLSLLGCGGIIWLALFVSANKRGKDNLLRAIDDSKLQPQEGISPYPRN